MRGIALGNVALKALTMALQFLPPTTDEGQAVAKAIATLGKTFSASTGDIERQEVKMMGAVAPPMNQPNPQQGAAWQQAVRDRMQGMGVGAPAGGPGGG